jgi:hypothetical protein
MFIRKLKLPYMYLTTIDHKVFKIATTLAEI